MEAGDEGVEGIYLHSEYQYVYLFSTVVSLTALDELAMQKWSLMRMQNGFVKM